MSTSDDDHDPLLDDLRAMFAKDDPVPPLLIETAKASLGWRRLDADLAELLRDSALVEEDQMALARGSAEAQIRSATFGAGRVTIDIDIQGDASGRRLLGQLSPAGPATVEIQSLDPTTDVLVAAADGLGRFRCVLPDAGSIRLRVGRPDAAAPGGTSWIETSWIPL